jgi:hypothetical protein
MYDRAIAMSSCRRATLMRVEEVEHHSHVVVPPLNVGACKAVVAMSSCRHHLKLARRKEGV